MQGWIELLFPFYGGEYLIWSLVCKRWHIFLQKRVRPETNMRSISTVELWKFAKIIINFDAVNFLIGTKNYKVIRYVYENEDISRYRRNIKTDILKVASKSNDKEFYEWSLSIGGFFNNQVYIGLIESKMFEEFDELPKCMFSKLEIRVLMYYFIELNKVQEVEYLLDKFGCTKLILEHIVRCGNLRIFQSIIHKLEKVDKNIVYCIISNDRVDMLIEFEKRFDVTDIYWHENYYHVSLIMLKTLYRFCKDNIRLDRLVKVTHNRDTYFWAVEKGARFDLNDVSINSFAYLYSKMDNNEVLSAQYCKNLKLKKNRKLLVYAREYQPYSF